MTAKPTSYRLRRALFILGFILPTFILFCFLTAYPLLKGLYISFFKWSGYSGDMTFIGIDNYKRLFQDEIIGTTIFNDYFLVIGKVVLILIIATFLAVALTRLNIKRSGLFRIILFFPNLISVVVIGVLWRYIYNPSDIGFLNAFLSLFSSDPVTTVWLGQTNTAMWSILAPAVWAGIGFYMILLMAAIMNIPESLYEASNIDGASRWHQFKHITIPLIWEQMKVSIIHIVITTLNGSFIIIWLMTEGGPDNSTQVMGSYLYQIGFKQYHMGYASAIGVLILVLTLTTSIILNRLMKRETVQM
ncbi:sugar ABC transporter permease [Paenibacillus sp. GSMTC-2017]|uniref:carbohydrate ABC transporter permease n=1 Tax=Paenibacillus sp. GSMTC-2017 TaxID=2794350 RepID=UPI0018D889D9|nr:sugar ABC transporter permease [Paenibacillus sp. GSMTC-2017]MBH5318913.1 sugar ABC transporter permease [Paenibacillus sp. GSMTC-2017]